MINKFEKIAVEVFEEAEVASIAVAQRIAELIKIKNKAGKTFVLGLATGATPIMLYKELIRLHQKEGLSFQHVVTFNLDEYYPISPDNPASYNFYMYKHLFNHIDIPRENIFIPDGSLDADSLPEYCADYEEKIDAYGGLDFQVLGIGRSGHIGYNEPGSGSSSETRPIRLSHLTRKDASADFGSIELVPEKAITMGIRTIMEAREIALLAFGFRKAKIIKKTIEGNVSPQLPASYLQNHVNTKFYIDTQAAHMLTRIETPWLVGNCHWSDRLIRAAVVWLSQTTGKAILKLQDEDYLSNGMEELISIFQSAYNINIKVFNDLQHTITGWPAGKPDADDTNRPERKSPFPKRTIIFSPHPDDDVISMGGTFIRLVAQGNEVHVAYQVSGNIAVADEDVINAVEFYQKYHKQHYADVDDKISTDLLNKLKTPREMNMPELPEILAAKGLIRRQEALAACRVVGMPQEHAHFLDLPFYRTGTIKKKPLSQEDIDITAELLREIKPHQVFAAGDWADPHGTHAVCWESIRLALEKVKDDPWMKDCHVWLYRGAWEEWPIHHVDMAVPLSPGELQLKIKAIFCHQSQKDNVLFPGKDKREFWERARDRNHATAKLYDQVGMAEYEAMEVFSRYIL